MPKTKFQEFIFTLITSGCMIFIMGVYNVAIHTGGLQAATFKHALHSFPLEWFIGLLCAFFIASKTSKYFAFRIAKPTDRSIFIILCIQTFTVCTMVPLMSLLGTIESSGITSNLIFYLAPDHLSKFSLWLYPTADFWLLVLSTASYSVTCSPPPTKELNLKSKTKWNSRDLQNNLLIIPYTIVPPVSYLFPHRRSYHLFFHISIFKCNYHFHTPVFHNPEIPEYTFLLPQSLP